MKKSKPISIRKLAAHVGKAHSTISRFLKAHESAPRDDLQAFAEYYDKHALKVDDSDGNEYAKERVLKLRADRRLAEERLAILRAGHVSREEVEELFGKLAAELAGKLRYTFVTVAPPQLGGLNTSQIKQKMEAFIDRIFDETREGALTDVQNLQNETKIKSAKRTTAKSKGRKASPVKTKGN